MILFDLDGVLVDSRQLVERIWRDWARPRGQDAARFIRVAHGRRTSETLREVAPELDVAAETAVLDAMEETATEGLVPIPGAVALLASLDASAWAVVTSGSRAVAILRLRTTGLPMPRELVTGDEVRFGKPDPEPYLLGARRTGVEPARCLVVEDSPAGVAAGKAAGMRVAAITTTHDAASLVGADVILSHLSELRL